jgi:1-acyl-sn-glycerol-3-phosphate acyltransferase
LALAVPEARIVAVSVTGAVDIVRFPARPRITVEFFEPADGQPQPGESAIALTRRVMAEVRTKAPPVRAGRK